MPRLDVTIAGEINLDLILYGLNENIPLDREVLASDFELTLGSSSGILAHNLSVLSNQVGFVTRFGNDELGRIAMDRLRAGGVELSRSIRSSGTTGVTILLTHGRSRRILTFPGVMLDLTVADLDVEYLSKARHFHLSSLFLQKGLHQGLPGLFRELKSRGLTISMDTNDDPEDTWGGVLSELLPLVDVLLPNDDEVRRISKRETVESAVEQLSSLVPVIAVKCGASGAIVQHRGGRVYVPGLRVSPVDTIGAGDSFNAGFLSAWLNGRPPEECARAGNVTAALSTQKSGGTEAFRDRALVEKFLAQNRYYEMIGR